MSLRPFNYRVRLGPARAVARLSPGICWASSGLDRDQFGTGSGPVRDWFGTGSGLVWDRFGTGSGSVWDQQHLPLELSVRVAVS